MPISASAHGDPRAAERTFQLLHQVIGRAGREAGRGVGYLQTHQPEHPVMQALIAQDREAFYNAEIALRERTPIRRSGGSRACSSPAPTSTRRKASRASSRPPRRATKTCACSVRPKRRSRWCAGAIASA